MMPQFFPVTCHTDLVGYGSIFVAIKGTTHDGAQFIPLAIEKGARAIVADSTCYISAEVQHLCAQKNISIEYVDNARKVLAEMSAQACSYPARRLRIIGITGTKGKTTSCFMAYHCLQQAGFKVALLSTVRNQIGNEIFPTQLTTQHPDYLQIFLQLCVERGIEYIVMEVAAQAITLFRIHEIHFDAILFTNFSQEHGEFYSTEDSYFQAKAALFNQLKEKGTGIINGDDLWVMKLTEKPYKLRTIGMINDTMYQGLCLRSTSHGTHFLVRRHGKESAFFTPLIGEFNIYNWLGVIALCDTLGIEEEYFSSAIALFQGAPGRLEMFQLSNKARCYIDYAHNPSSFKAVLSTLKPYAPHLVVVFGAGGDRDPAKRPAMGAIAAEYADLIILTSDNPRSENSATIAQHIYAGIPSHKRSHVVIILDRKQAIEYAYAQSHEKSIIALLGKGPDQYQLVQGIKVPFNEYEIIQSLS